MQILIFLGFKALRDELQIYLISEGKSHWNSFKEIIEKILRSYKSNMVMHIMSSSLIFFFMTSIFNMTYKKKIERLQITFIVSPYS